MTATLSRSAVRVVHMTTVHRPFDTRIFSKQAATLAAAGYDVALVQQGERTEERNGVEILPIPTYGSRLLRMTAGVARAVGHALRARAQVIHIHDLELVWGGLVLKAMGRRVIYDIHEDVAKDLDDKAYLPGWIVPAARAGVGIFERAAERIFDAQCAATRAIAARFKRGSTRLIRNTPIVDELVVPTSRPLGERAPVAAYVGGLAAFNGAASMVEAIGFFDDASPIHLVMGGRFPDDRFEAEVRGLAGWRKVDFRGWVDRPQMAAILADARCGLVVYHPTPNVVESEPNKFFEYLTAGLPLIASDFPAWRAFVEEHRCGILVDPHDPRAIADAIAYLVDHPEEAEAMGQRGRAAVLTDYNWETDAARLVALYDELTHASA